MINKELKVGDYIFNAMGDLARITKINKKTYSYKSINSYHGYYERCVIPFNGIASNTEWFYCNDSIKMALTSAMSRYNRDVVLLEQYNDIKKLWNSAVYYLEKIHEYKLDDLVPDDNYETGLDNEFNDDWVDYEDEDDDYFSLGDDLSDDDETDLGD